jgi:hypothetical protein
MKKLLLLLPLASLTACGSIDSQTAAIMAQRFRSAATAYSMPVYQPISDYQPIPSAIPETVPTYPPIVFQQLRAY